MIPHSPLAEIARKFVIVPAVAPAVVVATGISRVTGFEFAEGAAFETETCGRDARVFFDLASLTKSFVAATVARLVQRGRLDFETPLHDLLPEARQCATGSASLLLLLAHRAGLEAHRPLFAPLLAGLPFDRRAAISEVLAGRRPECAAAPAASGYPPVYSDLGFALVGLALERSERLPLDEIVEREVCAPLALEVGSARILRARRIDFAQRCMPTETVAFRGGEVRGVVHDENAWALSGHGLSGHAGLFGTAISVARFGAALLEARRGRSGWLDAKSFGPLLEERPGGTLRAGFDGKSADQSSAGTLAGPRTFGHLGFTGTSFWCDPDADRVLVLLTNRVCPSRDNLRIRAARPAVNDALYAFAG
ncbi:MAG TPA: serine hydrolase domain-containing protein [Polyangiaceae bacterium]|nr:serine hydrolase domain-containing protein [Polyangiaceae bacterium]